MNKLKVEIGGGDMPRPSFEQLDSRIGFNLISDDLPYEDNSIDIIYMSHIIEHIPLYNAQEVLTKIYNKLKVGGFVRILCPDLEKIIQAYVDKDELAFSRNKNHWGTVTFLNSQLGIGGMFINQILSPGGDIDFYVGEKKISSYAHVAGYDFEMIRNLLKIVGFIKIKRTPIIPFDTHQLPGQLVVNAWK